MPHGVNEQLVLLQLRRHPPMAVKDIAHNEGCTPQFIRKIAKKHSVALPRDRCRSAMHKRSVLTDAQVGHWVHQAAQRYGLSYGRSN